MNLKQRTHKFVEDTLDILFPIRLGLDSTESRDESLVKKNLLELLHDNVEHSDINRERITDKFTRYLPKLRELLLKDIQAIFDGDPAAKSKNEIIIAYPGFQAISCYRIAHYLLKHKVALLPRIITEYAHSETGIDIHPGAIIGEYLCIDHGTGVVIGETTVIGNHVKIYQGVTLGALSVPDRDSCPEKRHPTIGNHVIIYAQAIILGGDTVVGDHTIIGGNVWLTDSVPPYSKIYFDSEHHRDNFKIKEQNLR